MGIWSSIAKAFGFGGPSSRGVPPFPAVELGDGCGLAFETEALVELERRLASTFRSTFMEHVRGRVMASRPELTDAAYDWALFELRRFFYMTAICKEQVPMYSADADAIWHEMLLFTREYDTFCRTFAGRLINHEPHVEKPSRSAAYKKRAEFELIYGTLFRLHPMNERLLGAFRKHRFSAEEIASLTRMDADAFRALWFRDDAAAGADAARRLAGSVQTGAGEARKRGSRLNDPALASDYAAWLIAMSIWQDYTRKNGGDSGPTVNTDNDRRDGSGDNDGGSGDSGGGDGGSDGGGGDGGGSSCGGGCGGGCGGS